MGGRAKTGIELGISYSDTMLNHRLSQKLKLPRNGEFNHLTIVLTLLELLLGSCSMGIILSLPLKHGHG